MTDSESSPMLGRHAQYKAAQGKVVDWLATTAKATSITFANTAKLRSHELVSLAQSIRDRHIATPTTILNTLWNVIEWRQAYANWHRQDPTSVEEQDLSHQKFIDVLHRIHCILGHVKLSQSQTLVSAKAVRSHGKAKCGAATTDSVRVSLMNTFSCLELEDPPDPQEVDPADEARQTPQSITYIKRTKKKTLDVDFALWCQLEDQKDTRRFVRNIWLQYAAGSVSIDVAASTTYIALGLMRIMNAQFVREYPAMRDWHDVLRHFSLNAFRREKLTYVYPRNATSTSKAHDKDVIEHLCPAAALLLRDTRSAMQTYAATKEGGRLLRTGKYSSKPPRPGGPKVLTEESYDFSVIIGYQTAELVQWVWSTRQLGTSNPYTSTQIFDRIEFMHGIGEYYDTNILPLWLVTACAIHMDIYEVIGNKPGVAADALIDTCFRMEDRQKSLCDYFEGIRSTPAPPLHPFSKWFNQLKPILALGTERELSYRITTAYHQSVLASNPAEAKHFEAGRASSTAESSPCLAGNTLSHILSRYHRNGLRIANDCMMGLALASLYNAAKRLGHLTSTWEDMNFVLSKQKKSDLGPLIPQASGTQDGGRLFRQYLLALGIPINKLSTFLTGPPPPLKEGSTHHRKEIRPTSAYIIGTVIGIQDNVALGTFERGDVVETVLKRIAEAAAASSAKSDKKGKHSQATPQFTVAELLSSYQEDMMKEEQHIKFDYAGFYMVGERIKCKLLELEPTWTPNNISIHEIVYFILQDAALPPHKSHNLLAKASAMMQTIIDEPGINNKFSKEARDHSSGSISKTLKPKIRPYDPSWPGELWKIISEHADEMVMMNDHVSVASSGASHLTLYDSRGSKARFEAIFPAARRVWIMWELQKVEPRRPLSMGCYEKLDSVPFVDKETGEVVDVPSPISLKQLGLKGYEGIRSDVTSAVTFRKQTPLRANEDI